MSNVWVPLHGSGIPPGHPQHHDHPIRRDANGMCIDPIVLITGATGGIGRATAIAFAEQNKYHMVLHYNNASHAVRDEMMDAMDEAAGDQGTTKIVWFQGDLSSYDTVRALYQRAIDAFGRVDVLFNNAGTTGGQAGVSSLADVSMETFEQTWRVNTGSAILLTQLCLPGMEARGYGRIVFDSSVAAFTGGSVGPHYASSKSALHGFVHWLAGSVASKGVTVNAVAPAVVKGTNMMGRVEEDPEREAAVAKRVPVGRLGLPEEIAKTVLWMVDTGYLTNKVITVDGGMYPY